LSLPKACGAGASSDIPRRQRVVRGRRRTRRRPLRGLDPHTRGGGGENADVWIFRGREAASVAAPPPSPEQAGCHTRGD
jgi:hypothetical protein